MSVSFFRKREALVASLEMQQWLSGEKAAATRRPEGPRSFERFQPSAQSRWKLVAFAARGGYDDWPALDEIFVQKVQGVNPNRGLDGSVVEMDRDVLSARMRDYFSDSPTADIQKRYPVLMKDRARYVATEVRKKLRRISNFDVGKVVPYVVFPLDQRWLYYETEAKFLNEARPDLYESLSSNEFLVTVPEPRKASETRPLLLSTAFDLHVHDRGSVGFPVESIEPTEGALFSQDQAQAARRANLAPRAWEVLKETWRLRSDLHGRDARDLARDLVRCCLALCHSPAYQTEHKDSLAQDWAHVPIPKSRELLQEIVCAGDLLSALLNPAASAVRALGELLGEDAKQLSVPTKLGGGNLGHRDLSVEYSFFGGAQGGWRARSPSSEEPMHEEWGESTGDLYINDAVLFRHVPEKVWRYELGGYPVIKKWLGYRDRGRRPDLPLSVQEAGHFRGIVQRLAAVLRLQATLDGLYERACLDCFTTEELGL